MKTTKSRVQKKALLLSLASLSLLPGCTDWFQDKFGCKQSACQPTTTTTEASIINNVTMQPDGSEVLVTMDGKPVVTKKRLESEKRDLMESNPQLKMMLAMMDEKQLDRNLAEGLASQAIVNRYISESGIDNTAEYQQEYKRILASVQNMLNTKFFTKDFPTNISDSEARDFYEKNKQLMPQLIVSHGGVKATCVMFDSEDEARKFADKVKTSKTSLKDAADANKLSGQFKELNLVHNQSIGIDNVLKDKITSTTTFPTIDVCVLSDGKVATYEATEREESKYRPFEQIKEELKKMLEKQKTSEIFENEVRKLKDKYNVQFDQEFFKEEPQASDSADALEMMQ